MSTRYSFNKLKPLIYINQWLKPSIPAVCQMNILLWRRARHAVALKNYARATSESIRQILPSHWLSYSLAIGDSPLVAKRIHFQIPNNDRKRFASILWNNILSDQLVYAKTRIRISHRTCQSLDVTIYQFLVKHKHLFVCLWNITSYTSH